MNERAVLQNQSYRASSVRACRRGAPRDSKTINRSILPLVVATIILMGGYVPLEGESAGFRKIRNPDPLMATRRDIDHGLPTLVLDLSTIDTNDYAWKYHYVNNIPVSGLEGFGLLSGDLNENDKVEVYGLYLEQFQPEGSTRIYELTDSTTWQLQYIYPPRTGVIENIDDIDQNGLVEVYGRYGDSLSIFEQSTQTDYPILSKFCYRLYYGDAVGIPNEIYDVNSDGKEDLVYRGSEPDSIMTSLHKNYIAEYDTQVQNFSVIWSIHLPPRDTICADFCTLNMAVGDFDTDNRTEFVTSAFAGNAYVAEHVSGDSFSVTWSDSLSNAGRVGSGDVDGNGLEEFFVGGTQLEQDGLFHMRINAFERTADNSYEPYFEFDIFPVGYFSADLYQTADLDLDGQKELLISFKPGVVIIKGIGEHQYDLFYYKYVASADGLSAGDVDGDSIPELFVSRFFSGGQGVVTQTEVYRLDSILLGVGSASEPTPIQFRLYQNYPNPFNSSTTIPYVLEQNSHVRLAIFDLRGREVVTLVDEGQSAGSHAVQWEGLGWKGGGEALASGVYIYQLRVGNRSVAKKLLLLR